MRIEYRTKDHPEANGRTPISGEVQYPVIFPLENGDTLVVRMGKDGFDTLTNLLMDMLANTPSYSDGSVDL